MEFISARTRAEALDTLGERGLDAQILAGGTDVMIQYLNGDISPSVLVHIERLKDLRGVTRNGSVSLGPLTTHRALATDPWLLENLPAIAEAAATVGGWQTQAIGTIGGNLCNASPAADLAPPLLAAGAVVTLESSEGERSIPLGQFFLGRRKTTLEPGELLTQVNLPVPCPRTGDVYLKVGRRGAMEVALVGLSTRVVLSEEGIVDDVAIAVCSVAPSPYRVTEAEEAIKGSRLEQGALSEAADLLIRSARPITDFRADASYRRRVVGPLLERALRLSADRARS